MLTTSVLSHLRSAGQCIRQQSRRNIGVSAIALQKSVDPIQQLFAQKVREYAEKRKAAGGKLVDATPDVQNSLKEELNRVDQRFAATGKNMSKFPEFKFDDMPVEAPVAGEKTPTGHDLPF